MDTRDPWTSAMRCGDFDAAWKVSDAELARRTGRKFGDACVPRHLQFLWDGRALVRKRVLVHCYHGLGDTLQFVRLLPLLRRRAEHVVLWTQPALIGLLAGMPGVDRIAPLHDGSPEFDRDADIELMELAHALRVQRAELPRPPYLSAPAPARAGDERPRVGIAWRAGGWNPSRSVPSALLARLGEIPGLAWVSLQYPPEPLPFVATHAGCRDIVELACRMRALDLVISVDTMIAHLAGALGLRTWTLLPRPCDWRWPEAGNRSWWYPTMRLVRQPQAQDWESVMVHLSVALTRWRDHARAPDRTARQPAPDLQIENDGDRFLRR